jgi:hypothetical protein
MIIVHLIVGGLAIGVLLWLVNYARKRELHLKWYHWLVTVAAVLYGIFVLEVIVGFLVEGELRAALVIGTLTGLVAMIWFVLLGRLVFSKDKPAAKQS